MGNKSAKQAPSERPCASSVAELIDDVEKLNALTARYKTTSGESLSFAYDASAEPPVAPLWRQHVVVQVRRVGGARDDERPKALNFRQFYRLFWIITDHVPSDASAPRPKAPSTVDSLIDPFPENECSICMDAMADLVLPCAHAFCEACISGWKDRSNACPVCRSPIREAMDAGDVWTVIEEETDETIAQYFAEQLEKVASEI